MVTKCRVHFQDAWVKASHLFWNISHLCLCTGVIVSVTGASCGVCIIPDDLHWLQWLGLAVILSCKCSPDPLWAPHNLAASTFWCGCFAPGLLAATRVSCWTWMEPLRSQGLFGIELLTHPPPHAWCCAVEVLFAVWDCVYFLFCLWALNPLTAHILGYALLLLVWQWLLTFWVTLLIASSSQPHMDHQL